MSHTWSRGPQVRHLHGEAAHEAAAQLWQYDQETIQLSVPVMQSSIGSKLKGAAAASTLLTKPARAVQGYSLSRLQEQEKAQR